MNIKVEELISKLTVEEMSGTKCDLSDYIEDLREFNRTEDPYLKKGILDTLLWDLEEEYPEVFEKYEDDIKDLYWLTGLDLEEF